MEKHVNKFLFDSLVVGGAVWLVGFAVAMIAWRYVPERTVGWLVLPFLWVTAAYGAYDRLWKPGEHVGYCAGIALVWLAVAVVLDYLFVVRTFHPARFYDLDVLLGYAGLLVIPLVASVPHKSTTAGAHPAA